MTPLASFSPSGTSKLSENISKNPIIEMLTSLSKEITDNAFTTPKKLRKRKNICYSELDGSF